MDIDFEQFEQFLIKRDKKRPNTRPMSCMPDGHNRHYSTIEPYNQQSLFKKPDKIGCTIRVSTYEKSNYSHIKSITKRQGQAPYMTLSVYKRSY
jgi:hypothetical protein